MLELDQRKLRNSVADTHCSGALAPTLAGLCLAFGTRRHGCQRFRASSSCANKMRAKLSI